MIDVSRNEFLKIASAFGLGTALVWLQLCMSGCSAAQAVHIISTTTPVPPGYTDNFMLNPPTTGINASQPRTTAQSATAVPSQLQSQVISPTGTSTATSTTTRTSTTTSTYTPSATACARNQLGRDGIEFLINHQLITGDTSRKVVMMTYDDNPGVDGISNIYALMDALKKSGGKATFFFIGNTLTDYAVPINKLIAEGHEIGFHGWTHDNYRQIKANTIRKDMDQCFAAMRQIAPGYNVTLFRTPYGSVDSTVRGLIGEFGLQSVLWSVESGGEKPETYNYVVDRVTNGSIVLSHMTRYYDISLAPTITSSLSAMGYSLETITSGMSPKDVLPDALRQFECVQLISRRESIRYMLGHTTTG